MLAHSSITPVQSSIKSAHSSITLAQSSITFAHSSIMLARSSITFALSGPDEVRVSKNLAVRSLSSGNGVVARHLLFALAALMIALWIGFT